MNFEKKAANLDFKKYHCTWLLIELKIVKDMNRNFLFLGILCFTFFVSCSAGDTNDIPNVITDPVIVAKNVVVAHRGAWKKKNLPQNSIASLKEAIRLECKGAEFDILLTADDSLVVNHDDKYNNRIVQNSKYSDLVSMKLTNGEKLPTLREYILAGKENNATTKLICELKNYGLSEERKKIYVSETEKVVKELNAQRYIVYISFDYDILKQLRNLNSVSSIQYLNGNISPNQLKLDGMSGLDYNLSVYKSDGNLILEAKKNSMELGVWTVNTEVDMNFFLKNNFDFITTDEPELLLSKQ